MVAHEANKGIRCDKRVKKKKEKRAADKQRVCVSEWEGDRMSTQEKSRRRFEEYVRVV